MLALSCYILADTFFIARGLGPDGLAALNLAIPVYSFIQGAGLMAGMGGSTRYSILKAEGKSKDANRIFTHALLIGVFLSLIFTLTGIFGSDFLTELLGADSRVYSMTRTYLRVLLFFAPAFILDNIMICFIRNDSSPEIAMAAMCIGSFSNILLDYILIFPCKMGILGAVLATGLSPVIGLCILSIPFVRHTTRIKLSKIHLSVKAAADILWLGVPSLITEVASGTVIIVYNLLILKLTGNTGVAAYGIIANLSLVITSVFTGIAQGIQPIASYAYGSKRPKDVRHFYQYGIILSTILAVCLYTALTVFHQDVINIFDKTGNSTLFNIAKQGTFLYFLAFPFVGINIITSTIFSATEHPIPAFAVSITRGFALIIPCVIILSHWLKMPGIWLAFPVSEFITAIAALFILVKIKDTWE